MTQIQPQIVDEVRRLVEQAQREQLALRLMGGLAVRLHSPNMDDLGLQRDYPDLDFAVSRRDQARLPAFFERMGYAADARFNALNGANRQLYHDPHTGRHVDIFVGDFEMCHKLPLNDRLHLDPVTISLADLFLSKIQIVELNRKDATDLIALLLNNDLGGEAPGQIDLGYISRLCAEDWGLYTTTRLNLERLEPLLADPALGLAPEQAHIVRQRIERLRQALQAAPKGLRWQARDRIGKRVRWYTEVEEVRR